MSNATHTESPEQSPVRVKVGQAAYIAHRPSWADHTELTPDNAMSTGILHTWTAPTVAAGREPGDVEAYPVKVQVTQEDDVYVNGVGVVLEPGEQHIFFSDLTLDSANARLLAAALLECCDRLDAASEGDGE